jgi:hypothetical protein
MWRLKRCRDPSASLTNARLAYLNAFFFCLLSAQTYAATSAGAKSSSQSISGHAKVIGEHLETGCVYYTLPNQTPQPSARGGLLKHDCVRGGLQASTSKGFVGSERAQQERALLTRRAAGATLG